MLRYILIFGIIVLHVPPYVPLPETGSTVFDFFKAMMQHGVFRSSVPVLTCISGFLLYYSNLDLDFKRLFVKKTKSIFVPLVLFNIPLVLLVYIIQGNQLLEHSFEKQLYPFELSNWINAVFAVTESPINYPLNFLRDLFILSIAAPLFGYLLRQSPWLGLVLIFTFFWNNLDGDLILRNTMPITFYLGGMAAILRWDIRRFDAYAPILLLLFLGLCAAMVFFQIENRSYLRIVSPLLIWPAASLLLGTRFSDWIIGLSKYSLATFLLHGPLLLAVWLVYQKYFPSISYPVFWVSAPLIVAGLVVPVYHFSYRRFPRATRFALGGRAGAIPVASEIPDDLHDDDIPDGKFE